jgi:hypothetical protein
MTDFVVTGARNDDWRAYTMVGSTGSILAFSIWVAIWMWQKMSMKGSMGEEESKAYREAKLREAETK